MSDAINPSHYKHLPVEAIDIIMAAIARAPSNQAALLHGQVLKYVLRCWDKNGIEDLRKAKWYLDRLVTSFDDVLAEINAPILEVASNNSTAHPSGKEPPAGYRWLACGERLADGDLSISRKGVQPIAEDMAGNFVAVKWLFIRKIEAPPKRYREPTLADLANGQIKCEYRDFDGDDWVPGYLTGVIKPPCFGFRFRCHSLGVEENWIQCQIEVQE